MTKANVTVTSDRNSDSSVRPFITSTRELNFDALVYQTIRGTDGGLEREVQDEESGGA